jgi:APA family basic amino acid/polyamine antiporter
MARTEPASSTVGHDESVAGLKRVLGPFDVTMFVMGSIIGAGIFNLPSSIAASMGSTAGVLILWAMGGVFAFTGAIVFAELGGMLPHAGGQYVFVREAYGRFAAFLFGWVLLTGITSSALAFVAGVFSDHVESLARGAGLTQGFGDDGKRALSLGLIAFAIVLNARGTRLGALVQNASMLAKIAGIAIIVAFGALVGMGLMHTRPEVIAVLPVATPAHWEWKSAGGALLSVLFAYGGWQNVAAAAAEIRKPERTLPLGILFGTIGVIALYLGLNMALISILGVGGVAASHTPTADAAEAVVHGGQVIVSALVVISTFAFVQGLVLLAPRIYFAMALDGVFFRSAAYVHPKWRTPVVAIVVQGAIACVYVCTTGLSALVDIAILCDLMFFSSCGLALFVLRARRPDMPRPYRALGYPWLPAIFLMTTLGTVIQGAFNTSRDNALWGMGLFVVGALLYFVWRRGASTPTSAAPPR